MASATLISLFLLSALIFYSPSTTAQPVTDGYGNIIKNGGRVYIMPSLIGAGGIRRVKTDNETIPLSVVRSPIETDKGLPITISSPIRTEFLPEGPVFLSFEYIPLGVSSLQWTAVEGFPEGTVVKVVGYPNTLSGNFSIKKAGTNRYKLLFCKGVLCGNVAIVNDYEGHWLLVVTQNDPYVFVLEQVRGPSVALE